MSYALMSRQQTRVPVPVSVSVTTPLTLHVSWQPYGSFNLIHSFCYAAKEPSRVRQALKTLMN